MSGFNDFMDKAGVFAAKAAGKAKDLAAVAAEKTKQVSRVAKLNMDISAQRDTIKKAYGELGRLYYEAHGDAPEGPLAQACQEISMANEAIAKLEEEIAQIKAADDATQDADFESVVEATAAETGIEVEITEEPAESEVPVAPEAPAEPKVPVEPEISVEPEVPAEPEEGPVPHSAEPEEEL